MSNETRIRINSSAVVAAIVAIVGVIFSSGVVVQDMRQAIVLLRDIQHKQEVQHNEFLIFKDDMIRRVTQLERKAEILDRINIDSLRGYKSNAYPQ